MHPTPILATFSNISGRPKDMVKSEKTNKLAILPLNGYIPMSFGLNFIFIATNTSI